MKLGAYVGPDGVSLGSATYDVEYGVLLEADETVPVEERVSHAPARPATATGLVMSRPLTPTAPPARPSTGGARVVPAPHYGTSPGRYSASGIESLAGFELGHPRRPPSGTHRRVE